MTNINSKHIITKNSNVLHKLEEKCFNQIANTSSACEMGGVQLGTCISNFGTQRQITNEVNEQLLTDA